MEKFTHVDLFSEDMEILQKLGDNPNSDDGLTEQELKEKFDEAGIKIKSYLISTVTQINAIVDALNQQFDTPGNFLDGGSMLGALNMNGFPVTGLPEPENPTDAVPFSFSTKMDVATVTLSLNAWSGKSQTVPVDGVLADAAKQAIITVAAPDSLEVYLDSNIRLTGNGAGTLIFTCDDIPSAVVNVNVLVLTKGG